MNLLKHPYGSEIQQLKSCCNSTNSFLELSFFALESKDMIRKAFSAVRSFLATPLGVVFITAMLWHGVVWALNIPFNFIVSGIILAIDVAVVFFLVDRLTYFFSQFVLPIRNPDDRNEIYERVRDFDSGERGPILFVKNGRVIKHEGEGDKRGPGVLVLDTASAVVLRTDTEIVGAVGPGIRFTDGNEYIISHVNAKNEEEAIGVDLRTQWRFIGPMASDQPFLNPVPFADPKKYNDSEKRRKQTVGLTRDGFEVSPTISIKFRVKRPKVNQPTQSGVRSQFGYDPDAVRHAITREVVQLDKSENKKIRMTWKQLPEHLVVNLWREYVRKFKLEDLFTSSDSYSGLQTIEYMLNRRVQQASVAVLDDTGIPEMPPRYSENREFKELKERGLEVIEIQIHNLVFDPALEENLIQQWSADWMSVAKQEEGLLNEKAALIESVARSEATKQFVRTAAQKFSNPLLTPPDVYSALQDLIKPIKENLLAQSQASEDAILTLEKLDNILKWVLLYKQDIPKGKQGSS